MADEKPKSRDGNNQKYSEQQVFLLVGLFVLGALVSGLLVYIDSLGFGSLPVIWDKILNYFLDRIWPTWKLVAAVVSLAALGGIIHNAWKLRTLNLEEQKIYSVQREISGLSGPIPETRVSLKNKKWETVLGYLNSGNSSDWRLAIIEADVMLEELLRNRGYLGDSIGEMLKSVDGNDFLTLDDAWEAHKVRNEIAHAGQDYQVNERETKRVIALYEKVFKEFAVI